MPKIFPRHTVAFGKEVFTLFLETLLLRAKINKENNVKIFETAFAKYIGVKYAFGVSSGRGGLSLILEALNFKTGTEILISDYNFPPIPIILKQYGLKPVFIDLHPETHNLDVSLIEEKTNSRTGAIIVTHLFGQPCQMDAILEIAKQKGIKVIEDCAHACGSEYRGGKVGSFGEVSYFSFGPGKSLPCFGGGMVTTNNDLMANILKERCNQLPPPPFWRSWKGVMEASLFYVVTHHKIFPYTLYPLIYLLSLLNPDLLDTLQEEKIADHVLLVSTGYKLTNLQAKAGLAQLKYLDDNNQRRINNALFLNEELKSIEGIRLPKTITGAKNIYLYYRIMVEERDCFRKELLKRGIDSEKDDMRPCSALSLFNENEKCHEAEKVYPKSLEIPCNAALTKEDLLYIAQQIKEIIQKRKIA